MHKAVGQSKICNGIEVNTLIEEFFTRIKIDISAVVIQHRGHAIEAEAIEMELIEPILHIRQKEVLHATLAVIENHRIPLLLIASLARLRVMVA